MKEEPSCSTADASHLIPPQLLLHRIEDIKYRPPQQYESAGARASRMVIELSSYQTTPCSSPPNEFCDPGPNVESVVVADGKLQDTLGEGRAL
jgi:hypothetical protein